MGSSGDLLMTKQPTFGGEREGGLTEKLGRRVVADLICMVGGNISLCSFSKMVARSNDRNVLLTASVSAMVVCKYPPVRTVQLALTE